LTDGEKRIKNKLVCALLHPPFSIACLVHSCVPHSVSKNFIFVSLDGTRGSDWRPACGVLVGAVEVRASMVDKSQGFTRLLAIC
jgi:hypothetical protein